MSYDTYSDRTSPSHLYLRHPLPFPTVCGTGPSSSGERRGDGKRDQRYLVFRPSSTSRNLVLNDTKPFSRRPIQHSTHLTPKRLISFPIPLFLFSSSTPVGLPVVEVPRPARGAPPVAPTLHPTVVFLSRGVSLSLNVLKKVPRQLEVVSGKGLPLDP